jgi:hypothetical protein
MEVEMKKVVVVEDISHQSKKYQQHLNLHYYSNLLQRIFCFETMLMQEKYEVERD